MGARMTRELRLALINARLTSANELTLQRIETELGLMERPESPDAGRPWLSEGQPGGKSMEDS